MKANAKPVDSIELTLLRVLSHDHLKTTHCAAPANRNKGVMMKKPELVVTPKKKSPLCQFSSLFGTG